MIYSICSVADWLLGAALGTNFLGGLFSSSAQQSANQANLQAARETNALNRQMFDDQLAYNWKMFDATNKYNSPAHQRLLLEKAGYNPALLTGDKSTAQNISAPSPNPAVTGAPVQPVTGLGQNISNAVGSAAQSAMWLSSAQNQKADAALKTIDGITRAAENKEKLSALKHGNYAQEMDNMIKDLTFEYQTGAVKKNYELLSANVDNVTADTVLKNVAAELENEKINLTKEQANEVRQLIKNAIEEGKNIITQRDLLKAGIKESQSRTVLNYVNSEMAKVVGESQAAANYASAEASRATAQFTMSQKERQDMENKIYKKYGKTKALAELVNLSSQTQLNEWQSKKAALEILKVNREYQMLPIDRIADFIGKLGGAAILLMLL